jgi:hypothetical protein
MQKIEATPTDTGYQHPLVIHIGMLTRCLKIEQLVYR